VNSCDSSSAGQRHRCPFTAVMRGPLRSLNRTRPGAVRHSLPWCGTRARHVMAKAKPTRAALRWYCLAQPDERRTVGGSYPPRATTIPHMRAPPPAGMPTLSACPALPLGPPVILPHRGRKAESPGLRVQAATYGDMCLTGHRQHREQQAKMTHKTGRNCQKKMALKPYPAAAGAPGRGRDRGSAEPPTAAPSRGQGPAHRPFTVGSRMSWYHCRKVVGVATVGILRSPGPGGGRPGPRGTDLSSVKRPARRSCYTSAANSPGAQDAGALAWPRSAGAARATRGSLGVPPALPGATRGLVASARASDTVMPMRA
jgi:hypothetical protein